MVARQATYRNFPLLSMSSITCVPDSGLPRSAVSEHILIGKSEFSVQRLWRELGPDRSCMSTCGSHRKASRL